MTPGICLRRLALTLLLVAALGGCVTAPAERASGEAAGASRPAFAPLDGDMRAWLGAVHDVATRSWYIPEALARKNLEFMVRLTADRTGRVLRQVVERRSGDPDLDRSVFRAIEKVQQAGLPLLPDGYPHDRFEFGLIFNPMKR